MAVTFHDVILHMLEESTERRNKTLHERRIHYWTRKKGGSVPD